MATSRHAGVLTSYGDNVGKKLIYWLLVVTVVMVVVVVVMLVMLVVVVVVVVVVVMLVVVVVVVVWKVTMRGKTGVKCSTHAAHAAHWSITPPLTTMAATLTKLTFRGQQIVSS